MKILQTAGACLALFVAACNTDTSGPSSAMDASLDKITQEGIYAHYAYLADDKLEGRLTGAFNLFSDLFSVLVLVGMGRSDQEQRGGEVQVADGGAHGASGAS